MKSPGEKRIHNALQASTGRDDWRVLYSLDIRNGLEPFETEADFVVLAPGLGILFVEVKACQTLSFDGHIWKLGQKSEQRGPYKQARNAMHGVRKFLQVNGIDVKAIPFYSAVWFTELSRNDFPSAVEREEGETLAFEDLQGDIGQKLQFLMHHLSSPAKGRAAEFTTKVCDRVQKILRPRLEIAVAPLRTEELIEQFTNRALDEQLAVFEAYREHNRVLIDSLAGTGKTYVAIQAAKEAATNGSRVLFICHNRFLAKFLRAELAEYRDIYVSTVKALMLEVSGLEVPDDLPEDWWDDQLPSAAISTAQSQEFLEKYDCLIVDEAQDIGTIPNLVFLDAIMEGGFVGSERLFFAGDFSHQDLFVNGQEAKSNLIGMSGSATVVVNQAFGKNCRNTYRVGLQLMHWVKLDPAWSGYRRSDDAGRPLIIRANTDAEILKAFDVQLTAAKKKYPLESIVVLTRSRDEVSTFIRSRGITTTDASEAKANCVRLGSPFDFKGLESKCVLFVELTGANINFEGQLYVAGTRTTGDLYLAVDNTKMA